MTANNTSQTIYEIRVAGELGGMWSDWFEDFSIRTEFNQEDGQPITVLTGTVPDQPALHGLLAKIGGLNLTLLSFRRVESPHESEAGSK